MTTPKELADKAKQQAEANRIVSRDAHVACEMNAQEYEEHLRTRGALHDAIDQLQAMAEARQGSGEPVAYWIPKTEQFCIADKSGRPFAKAWEPLYDAPPSAQQAPGSGQVLDYAVLHAFAEAHRVGYNELCAAVRAALAAVTQAQPAQADEVHRLASALRNMRSNAAPRALSWTWADCKVASEAADMLDRLAAPTTGKREPLPSAETLLTWAVEDGVIRLSQMMNADLQDALVNFAARITGGQR